MTTTTQAPTGTARGTVLAAAGLTIMAAAIIAPSLPAMTQEFAGTPGVDMLVRLSLTVTSLAIAVSAPLSGLVADRAGRRPLLLAGLALYAVSGTAGLVVTDLAPLLASRTLLGVAVGGIMTAVSTIITDWFDGPRRAAFLGRQQAAASLGGVVFLPLAGVLAAADWRAPFWLYAAAIVIVPFAFASVPHTTARTADEDRVRDRVGDRDLSPTTAPEPGVSRQAIGIYAIAFTATLVFFMAPTQLPFLLEELGAGPAVTGAVVAVSTLSSAAAALAFPMVRRRLDPGVITAASVALLGAGWAVIGISGDVLVVVAGLLIGGTGVGFAVPNLNLRLSVLAAPNLRGRVLSGLVAGIFLGQFLSPLLAQPLIQNLGIAGTFTWTGLAMAATAIVAGVIARK